jgi:hypothetical protein
MRSAQLISLTFKSALIWSLSLNTFAASTIEEFLNGPKTQTHQKNSNELDDYSLSPLSRLMTRQQYSKFQNDLIEKDRHTEMMEGKLITFNTQDKAGCAAARKAMKLGPEVCKYDAKNPLVSVVVMRPVDDRNYFEKKIDFSKMSQKEKVALQSVFAFGVMGAGTFGVIYSLPESVSKWDKSEGFSKLADRYSERVKQGPVIDKDDWALNYIGHPLSGAYYYTMVRHQGFSPLQSAAFSFCMSTFFWEYGIEAIAEVPSIQDLILTPLIGSILGEVFYSWGNAIDNNGGTLMGSKALGKTATVLMNPAGALAKKINKIFKYEFIKDAELSLTNKSPVIGTYSANEYNPFKNDPYYGLKLEFKF